MTDTLIGALTDTPLHVALIVGSVRTGRLADALLPWLRTRLDAASWLTLDVVDLAEEDLDPRVLGGPSPIAGRLDAADAFVVLTPEYNHSYPAALKHAIDTHRAEWRRKPVAFVSYGARSGGIRAVEHLRGVFAEVEATTTRHGVPLSTPWEHLGPDGFVPPPGTDDALEATLAELRWWGTALRGARLGTGVPA